MRRLGLAMAVAVFGAACSGGQPPPASSDGGDFGLPPEGDGGRVFSMGQWETERESDPDGYRLLAGFARAYAGQSADTDGDGELDLVVWREADGTLVTWNVMGRAAFRPVWVLSRFLDGRRTLEVDRDEDATADVVIEEDPATRRRVEQYDDDFDDKFERRRIITSDPAAGTQLVVEERDPQQNNQWVEVRRYTLPLAADQGGGACDGNANFPLLETDPFINATPTIGITVEGDVRCEGANLVAVKKAVRCAVKKIRDCLGSSNALLQSEVQAALSSKQIILGCRNPCPGKDASTLSPRMNLRTDFHTLTEDEACNVVMHELMHHADVEREETHDDGLDRIYACSRYCNKCVKRGPTMPPPSDQDDCVTCAGTVAEKKKCGVKEEVQGGACTSNALCSGGLAGNMPCSQCNVKVVKDCMGSRVDDQETYLCCAMCPPMYPTNSNPCSGNPTLYNTCNMKPPGC